MFSIAPPFWSSAGAQATLTPGTIYTDAIGTIAAADLRKISATEALWLVNTGNYDMYATVLTNTAGVISFGTGVTLGTKNGSRPTLAMLSSTKAVAFWSDSSNDLQARVINISGTTLTLGANTYLVDASAAADSATTGGETSSTAAAVAYLRGSDIYGAGVTVSGDVITVGTPTSLAASAPSGLGTFLVWSGSTVGFLLYYKATTGGVGNEIYVSGTTITPDSTPETFDGSAGGPPYACASDTAQADFFYVKSSDTYGLRGQTAGGLSSYGTAWDQNPGVLDTNWDVEYVGSDVSARVYHRSSRVRLQLHKHNGVDIRIYSPEAVISTAFGQYARIAVLSSTDIMAVWMNDSDGYLKATMVTIS